MSQQDARGDRFSALAILCVTSVFRARRGEKVVRVMSMPRLVSSLNSAAHKAKKLSFLKLGYHSIDTALLLATRSKQPHAVKL